MSYKVKVMPLKMFPNIQWNLFPEIIVRAVSIVTSSKEKFWNHNKKETHT